MAHGFFLNVVYKIMPEKDGKVYGLRSEVFSPNGFAKIAV
jgi:hypothetical protein